MAFAPTNLALKVPVSDFPAIALQAPVHIALALMAPAPKARDPNAGPGLMVSFVLKQFWLLFRQLQI
jgi:hypothetical protein